MNLRDRFVANVAVALDAKGWTRVDLAKALNVSHPTVYQQLSGSRGVGLEVIEKYAKALGVKDPAHLLREREKILAKAS